MGAILAKKSDDSKTENFSKINEGKLKNAAYVFIKPHANNTATQALVKNKLEAAGITIVKQGSFSGGEIDKGMLIDNHYYAIASKATLLKANEIPVPKDKFQSAFNVSWDDALSQNRAFNALDAKVELGVDGAGLDALWGATDKIKFGGGFYCGEIKRDEKPSIFTFNAFFMTMRGKFVDPAASIHYFVAEFDPEVLPWKDFRGKVLGPTDPTKAPVDSLRGKILAEWKELGLPAEPNTSDNCVHASASPFEGLGERMNWLKVDPAQDDFGKAVIKAGIPVEKIQEWSKDPQVNGKSVFDQLEDTNAKECIEILVNMYKTSTGAQ